MSVGFVPGGAELLSLWYSYNTTYIAAVFPRDQRPVVPLAHAVGYVTYLHTSHYRPTGKGTATLGLGNPKSYVLTRKAKSSPTVVPLLPVVFVK